MLAVLFSAKAELASIADPRPTQDPSLPPPTHDLEIYARAMSTALQTRHVAVELIAPSEQDSMARVKISWGRQTRHHRELWVEDETLYVLDDVEYADQSRRQVIELYHQDHAGRWDLIERELLTHSHNGDSSSIERSLWLKEGGHWRMESEYDVDADGIIDWREFVVADSHQGNHRRRRYVDVGADGRVEEISEEWLEHGEHVARQTEKQFRGRARLAWPAPPTSSYLLPSDE